MKLDKRLLGRVELRERGALVHGIIVALLIGYGFFETSNGRELSNGFWGMALATLGFAILARRTPAVLISSSGIEIPESGEVYRWDAMCEARSRAGGLHILLQSGERVEIRYARLARRDVCRLKRIVQAQFEALSVAA